VTRKTINLRLPAELDDQLREHAHRDQRSANTVVVLAIQEYLNRHAAPPAPIDNAEDTEPSNFEQRVQRSVADLEAQLGQPSRPIDPEAADLDGRGT
jgi:hypothetical protein